MTGHLGPFVVPVGPGTPEATDSLRGNGQPVFVAPTGPESSFAPPSVLATEPPRTRPSLIRAEDFIAQAGSVAREWWWDGLLPWRGVVMLAGSPFSAKTITMLLLAAASGPGSPVAGRAVKKAKVVYAKLEHLDQDFAAQLVLVKAGANASGLANLFITKELHLDEEDSLVELEEQLDDVEADVLIIDSLRRATACDENNSQDAAEIVRRLHRLTGDGRRLVIVLHHLAKSATASPRGSGDFLAGVDTFVAAKKVENVVTLTTVHHAGGEADISFALEGGTDRLLATPVGSGPSVTAAAHSEIDDAILRVCDGEGLTRTGIRTAVRHALSATGIKNETIDGRVDALAAAGRLRNHGSQARHCWRSVPAGGSSFTSSPSASSVE